MLRRFSVNFAIFSMVIDIFITYLTFSFAIQLRPNLPSLPFLIPATLQELNISPLLYGIVPILWVITFLMASVYDPKRIYKITDELQNVLTASGLAALIFAGVLYLSFRDFSRWLFISFNIINLLFLLGWRIFLRLFFRIRRYPLKKRQVLVIGAGKVGQRVGYMIREYEWAGLEMVGYLDDSTKEEDGMNIIGDLGSTRAVVSQYDVNDVVIALPQRAYNKINQLVLALHDLPVHVRVVPDYFSLALYRASVEDFSGVPMINLRDPALNEVQRLIKRVFDLLIGSVLLLISFPLILVVALLIRLDSKGPVIFRQQRIGENGRVFKMYKFRTMIVGAEMLQHEINGVNGNGDLINKKADDPRVTSFGKLLRRTSLDELPQLLNVLLGDMSLVGPRPEQPWMVNQYEPWQHKRFAVPQGMTGWWQVNGRSDKPLHLHTEDDLYYVQNYSIWMDIYILVKTPWVVFRGKGAY